MLAISLITLGSPDQLTGGYLYHRRMAEAAPAHGASVSFVSVPEDPFPLPARWAWAVLDRTRSADVIVVDSIAAAFVAPGLWRPRGRVAMQDGKRRRRPPVAASLHQPPGGIDHGRARTSVQALLDRSLYRRAGRLIAASQALAEELVDGGLPGHAVRVVPPGRDGPAPSDQPLPDLRRGRQAALLTVGNWVPRKGIVDALEAVARLPAGVATLHLVGRHDVDRTYAARVRDRLAAPDLAGRVVVHGPVSRKQVALFYGAADVLVVPSRREPYGTVYGEAMSAGLPVAGWRSGNLPHLARDGQEGLVVEPGDLDALAAGLAHLATDAGYRSRLGRQAAARARSFPTWEQSAAAFFTVLRELAPESPRAGHGTHGRHGAC